MKTLLLSVLLLGYVSNSFGSSDGDAYTRTIAERFGKDPAQIARLFSNGYGRSELITLILISKAADKELLDVVLLRKHGHRFSDICSKLKVDWTLIQERSFEERNAVDAIVTAAEHN